ncbi:MAG: flavohemoglobin expression-modulating QEGLA motif protein [Pseudomonadota bacterium]
MQEYRKELRELSDKLLEAERPIRILDAIKWDETVLTFLQKTHYKELPDLGPAYYARNPLGFHSAQKLDELARLDEEILRRLGDADPLGSILRRNVSQYMLSVQMLEERGTPKFYEICKQLYGSSLDTFLDEHTQAYRFGEQMGEILENLDDEGPGTSFERNIPAKAAVRELGKRLKVYFPDQPVRAILSDGIVADAAAGTDYVKIRSGSMFSKRDLQILEVHEGWVHLGTSLNGQKQPYATWLAKGPPCVTAIQEGLAVLLELFSFVTFPSRARKLVNRLRAVHLAEKGANVLEIYEFFRAEKNSDWEAFHATERIYRGGDGRGAPFTKDICYTKGFILIYNFMRTALRAGRVDLLPCLFVGKATLEDIPILRQAMAEGHVVSPAYVPMPFKDLNALATWMSFSNFFNRIDLEEVYKYYEPLFRPPRPETFKDQSSILKP